MNMNEMTLRDAAGVRRGGYKAKPDAECGELANCNILCGIEIELENFAKGPKGVAALAALEGVWDEHNEGSLVNGREFVLCPPRNGRHLVAGIDTFFDAGFQYTGGERTSVHIHMDMMDGTTVGQFRALFALTFIVEGAVYRLADENRKWGGYSCPLIDMGPDRLNKILTGKSQAFFHAGLIGRAHEDKYYGFNPVSLTKHGTIEMRYFPCTDDKHLLYQWLNLCLELKTAASKFATANALLQQTDTEAKLVRFLNEHLPRSADAILQYLDRPDAVERNRILLAVLADQDAEAGASRKPKNAGFSKSLKKAVAAQGWDKLDAAEEQRHQNKINKRVIANVDQMIGPDGQIRHDVYQNLMQNIRGRVDNINNRIGR